MSYMPGPWSAMPDIHGNYAVMQNETSVIIAVMTKSDKAKANACAIAALPEIIDHLKTALTYLQRPTPQAKINELFRAARPLLRKIEEEEGVYDE